ncbi:MAG: hypothetical protein HY297_00495 [Thaumarchaeota archaeon]|nr:hypothetical protein [Nitrososphaerota archaeon]
MRVGYATLVSSLVMTPIASGGTGVDFTFKVTNIGLAEVTSFLSRGTLPAGLGCGITNGTGITCAAGVVSINHTSIAASTTKYAYMKVNVTTPRNYVIPPFSYQETSAGNNISGWSNPVGMPTGFLFSKQYQPSELFAGMTSTVTVMATNSGPFGIHNATVSAIVDSFDTLTGSAASNTSRLVAPGAGLSFHYGVLASSTTFGTLPSSEVFSNFYFSSTSFSVRGPGPNVTVYQPLSASITTVPASPTEGKPFTISVRISNPSAANVSSVLFTLPLPAGLSLTELENASLNSGVLTVSFGSIAAGSAATATSTAGASSGIAVPFEKAKLTFVYQGATVNGKVPSKGIAIGEDVTTRYIIPTGIVLVVLLATAFYVRRAASVSVQAAQK